MNCLIRKHTKCLLYVSFICIFTSSINSLHAQDFSLSVSNSSFTIAEKSYSGYSSKMKYSYTLIKKEWWKYIKRIAVLDNHKTHYIITFPADGSSEKSGLSLISIIIDEDSSVSINTALANQKNNEKFNVYAKNLLLGFKVKFYTSIMQKQIVKSEKEASKISLEIANYKKKVIATELKKEKGKGNRIGLSRNILSYKAIQDSLNIELQSIQHSIELSKSQLKNIR